MTDDFLKDVLVPLNDESSPVPRLRMYNWAVTNYAKGKGITTKVVEKDGKVKFIDPCISYNSTLKKLHRPLFDPYRRGTLLFFRVSSSSKSSTSESALSSLSSSSSSSSSSCSSPETENENQQNEIQSGPLETATGTGTGTGTTLQHLTSVHHTTVGQLLFVKWCIDNGVDKYVQSHETEIRQHLNTTAKLRSTRGKKRVKELTESTCKYARILPVNSSNTKNVENREGNGNEELETTNTKRMKVTKDADE